MQPTLVGCNFLRLKRAHDSTSSFVLEVCAKWVGMGWMERMGGLLALIAIALNAHMNLHSYAYLSARYIYMYRSIDR